MGSENRPCSILVRPPKSMKGRKCERMHNILASVMIYLQTPVINRYSVDPADHDRAMVDG